MAKKLDIKELIAMEFDVPSDQKTEFDKAASVMKQFYDSLIDVGFCECQALLLLIQQMSRK